ncbi:MAG: hypothetical protein AAF085_14615 [Planctomycetota bacterium]
MASRNPLVSDLYSVLAGDIFKFCEAMNFTPTFQQNQLFEAVQQGMSAIAVRSGQGPGKTTASAIVGLWRGFRRYMHKGVITAPTMRQAKDVWMAEARQRLEAADPFLKQFIDITNTRVTFAGQRDWSIELVTANREENAQGYHREDMTIIAEEASGIPRGIITQFMGTLSNPDPLFILIGNPNTRDCAFFDCFNAHRPRWHCIHWNAEETPDSAWFDQRRNRELEEQFGRDSDVYRVRVLGEFPHSDPNCVVSSEHLEKVIDKKLMLPMVRACSDKQFGMDFARFGGDENTVYRRSGKAIIQWKTFPRNDPNDVLAWTFAQQQAAGWQDHECHYVADAGGMGQGLMKNFHNAGKIVTEFQFHHKPQDIQYGNRITEAWFNFAKQVRKQDCYLPNDSMLLQQLSTRQYKLNAKGRIVLETKDEYARRMAGSEGSKSPDRADGCVLAYYDDLFSETRFASRNSRRQMNQDPFAR